MNDSLVCGLHHVGVHVPDLEAGRRFYENVFGFEVIGLDSWDEGHTHINNAVGLDESAADGYMMRGANTYLEVWTYRSPANQRPASYRASDHGYTHLCFEVSDFDTVLKRLIAAGGSVDKPVRASTVGGAKFHYCRDPFGNIIELLQMPDKSRSRLRNLAGINAVPEPTPRPSRYYLVRNGDFALQDDLAVLEDIVARP